MSDSPWTFRRLVVGGMTVTDPSDPAISKEELKLYRAKGFGHLLEALAFLQPRTVVCVANAASLSRGRVQEQNPFATAEEVEALVTADLGDARCDERLPLVQLPVFHGRFSNVEDSLGMFYLYNVRVARETADLVTVTCNAAPGIEGVLDDGSRYLRRVGDILARFMDKRDVGLTDGRLFRVTEFQFPFDVPSQRWTGHVLHEEFKGWLTSIGLIDRDESGGVLKAIRRPG